MDTTEALNRNAVANYIAKYVTKSLDAPGLPDSPIRHMRQIAELRCAAHYKKMIETAWQLGHRKWAHALGYGGHPITKSRRYSVTYGELRTARRDHRRAQRHPDGERDPGAARSAKPPCCSSPNGPTRVPATRPPTLTA